MAFNSTLIPGTFKANDAEWRVTKDAAFIVLVKDLESGEEMHMVGPFGQWHPEVQRVALMQIEAWEYTNCVNVK